ncbi:MAG: hypothetical protein Q8K96_01545 [Rubrivivax sp.]|nr:hypothetical protein [Rubrivivax sp.]
MTAAKTTPPSVQEERVEGGPVELTTAEIQQVAGGKAPMTKPNGFILSEDGFILSE